MDPKDIRTLKILEQVDNGRTPSQRDLAGELNISLGLVNSFIKRLVKKGFVKIRTIPKKNLYPRGRGVGRVDADASTSQTLDRLFSRRAYRR